MVNQILKPIIKPFPILLKSQFAIEILSHNKGESLITWPLIDLIYLLLQEELNEEQGVTIQTIIENNPMLSTVIQEVHEHHSIKNTYYSRPINVINQQLLLINTLLKTSHTNPVLNYQEMQNLINLNMKSYQENKISNTGLLSEITNEHVSQYAQKYFNKAHIDNRLKRIQIEKASDEYNSNLMYQSINDSKHIRVDLDNMNLTTYAKLYTKNELNSASKIHLSQKDPQRTSKTDTLALEVSTSTSEHHFLSKIVNRILGRNLNKTELKSTESPKEISPSILDNTYIENRTNEDIKRHYQWSVTQLLTAIEASMPISHYINQTFIYRTYLDHKVDLIHDEIKTHIQFQSNFRPLIENKLKQSEAEKSVLKNMHLIKHQNHFMQKSTFSKTQLKFHENKLNAMLQYVSTHKIENQELSPEFNQGFNQELNSELNQNLNQNLMHSSSQSLNHSSNSNSNQITIRKLNPVQKKNDLFINSIKQTIKVNNSLNEGINEGLNSNIHSDNITKYNSDVHINNENSGHIANDIFNNLFKSNPLLTTMILLRTSMDTMTNNWVGNTHNDYNEDQNHDNYLSEDNSLYRSLNLINSPMDHNKWSHVANSVVNRTVVNHTVIDHSVINHTVINKTIQHRSLYEINNLNNERPIYQNVLLRNISDTLANFSANNAFEYSRLHEFNRTSYSKNVFNKDNANYLNRHSSSNIDVTTNNMNSNNSNSNIRINNTNTVLNPSYFESVSRPIWYENLNESLNKNFSFNNHMPLMLYHMTNKHLHNDYQSALNHILLTTLELENKSKLKVFNANYLKAITEKYNALKRINNFALDITNGFSNEMNTKTLEQVHHYLEQINAIQSFNFEPHALYTQSNKDYKTNITNSDHQDIVLQGIELQAIERQGADHHLVLNTLIHNTTFTTDHLLTHRFNPMSRIINDAHSTNQISNLKSDVLNHMDQVLRNSKESPKPNITNGDSAITSLTNDFNNPKSLISLAASLVKQSNQFLEHHPFFNKNEFQKKNDITNLLLQTSIVGGNSLNFFLPKLFWNQKGDTSLDETILNQTFSEGTSFENTYKMLYLKENASIYKNEFLSKGSSFTNQSKTEKNYVNPESSSKVRFKVLESRVFESRVLKSKLSKSKLLETKRTLRMGLKVDSKLVLNLESEFNQTFNPIFNHEQTRYLRNITENKVFLSNLKYTALGLTQKIAKKTNVNVNQHSVYKVKALLKNRPIRTQAKYTLQENGSLRGNDTVEAHFTFNAITNNALPSRVQPKVLSAQSPVTSIVSVNKMAVNPKIITLKIDNKAFDSSQISNQTDQNRLNLNQAHNSTKHFAAKWQNTVILKSENESIKLTFNASYMRQRITPIHKTDVSSVDYTKAISLLTAELIDVQNIQKTSQKMKGRKSKKAAKKNMEKRIALENEIERLKFQSEEQTRTLTVHYPELIPSYFYQSLKDTQKKLKSENIIQRQLHYKNQFSKSKKETAFNLSERTLKTVSNNMNNIQKNIKLMHTLHDIKTATVSNNMIQMSTFLLQKQTLTNLTQHTDKVMSYSEVESSPLSHKIVEREILREIVATPEMASVLPREPEEQSDTAETAVVPLQEMINIDKIADQVYKRVTDRVERERRRRGL